MRRRLLSHFSLVLALVLVLSGIGVDQGALAQSAPQRFLVFTTGAPGVNQGVRQAVARARGDVLDEIRVEQDLEFLVVRVPGSVMRDLAQQPGVHEVASEIPPVPFDDTINWGVDRIDAECVWALTLSTTCRAGYNGAQRDNAVGSTSGEGVVVAITDTGVQLNHPDLQTNLTGPHADCTTDGQECNTAPGVGGDTDGHGTHVAGIVGATDNGAQTIGVSPKVSLLSVKCLSPSTFNSCLRAVRYAGGRDQNGTKVSASRAKVVNMSWGWSRNLERQCRSCVRTIEVVMNQAWNDDGLVLVAAAGNEGISTGRGDNVGYPARVDSSVIAVAATDWTDVRASFSSTGPSVDLAAPGVGIVSSYLGGGTADLMGTSMASPHVAGAAALVISSGITNNSNSAVRNRLEATADDLGASGRDSQFGLGLVDAQQAATTQEELRP